MDHEKIRQGHIDRFLAGKDVWNEWAKEMLREKEALETAGKWEVREEWDGDLSFARTMSEIPETQNWLDRAFVNFSALDFLTEQSSDSEVQGREVTPPETETSFKSIPVNSDVISFSGFLFPGAALFSGAKFTGAALFSGAKFTGEVLFTEAKFTGAAWFSGAKFTGEAWFSGAKFAGEARFNQADFKSFTSFEKSRFQNKSNFEAIHVERGFSLEDAEFTAQVPSFIQAHFKEAPRLDNITVLAVPKVGPPLKWRRYFWQKKLMQAKARYFRKIIERVKFGWQRFKNFCRDKDEEARYRALKRLAIQAHDHDNEQKFFAGEMRARRHIRDFANPLKGFSSKGFASVVRYWAGVLYEFSSDFGRSIWRPLLIWIGVCYLFSWLYLAQSVHAAGEKCINSPTLTTTEAAYTISYKNAILFISADRTDKLKRAYACLYGASPLYPVDQGKTDLNDFIKDHGESARIGPNVPYVVAKLGILHSLLSAVLIFLLLLGVRNQFKIK